MAACEAFLSTDSAQAERSSREAAFTYLATYVADAIYEFLIDPENASGPGLETSKILMSINGEVQVIDLRGAGRLTPMMANEQPVHVLAAATVPVRSSIGLQPGAVDPDLLKAIPELSLLSVLAGGDAATVIAAAGSNGMDLGSLPQVVQSLNASAQRAADRFCSWATTRIAVICTRKGIGVDTLDQGVSGFPLGDYRFDDDLRVPTRVLIVSDKFLQTPEADGQVFGDLGMLMLRMSGETEVEQGPYICRFDGPSAFSAALTSHYM